MDDFLQSKSFCILKCELLNKEILDYTKNKVNKTLDMNKITNVVRNLHDISTWTELHDLWGGIEKFCLMNFLPKKKLKEKRNAIKIIQDNIKTIKNKQSVELEHKKINKA